MRHRLEALLEKAHIKILRRHWPHSPIGDCGPRPGNCATPSVRAWIFIRCIAGW
jgi:hypothetical protein